MAYVNSAPVDFSAIPEAKWPDEGSYIIGFDSVSGHLTKLDFEGTITDLETGGGNMDLRTPISGLSSPMYPAATKGQVFNVTVAGKVGGISGKGILPEDCIVCITDNAGGDEATVGANFIVVRGRQLPDFVLSIEIGPTDAPPPS